VKSQQKQSVQQANVTELTEMIPKVSALKMNDQQQSFRTLTSSIIDSFLADHVPATVLFNTANVSIPASEERPKSSTIILSTVQLFQLIKFFLLKQLIFCSQVMPCLHAGLELMTCNHF